MKNLIGSLSITLVIVGGIVTSSTPVSAQSLNPSATNQTTQQQPGVPTPVTGQPASPGNTTPGGSATSTPGGAPPNGTNAANVQTASGATSQNMAPIIVTGSYIPVTDTTSGPSPLQIISSEQIALRGDTTLDNVLSHNPETGSFSNKGTNDGDSFSGAATYVSLKGLGPQATLVLINGLRTAPFGDTANGQFAFTDLNSISVEAIDHVEVLTDGGSAIYGSDAIAGVVNIILKKDLGDADAQTDIFIGNTTDHDAFEQQYGQAFSLNSFDKNGQGVVVLDFYNRNSIFDRDRDYATSANLNSQGGPDLRSVRTFPGTFVGTVPGTPEDNTDVQNPSTDNGYEAGEFTVNQKNGPLTAADPNINPIINPNTGLPFGIAPANYNTGNTLIPSTSRYGTYLNYGYNFYGGDVRPNIDFSYRHIDTMFYDDPSGYFLGDNSSFDGGAIAGGIPVPTTNPYNRTGQLIDIVSYRFFDQGERTTHESTDDFRVVPSLHVALPEKWEMNVDFNYSYSWTSDLDGGEISLPKLIAALANPNPGQAYNPFTNNPNANQYVNVQANDTHDAYTSLLGQDIRFDGPLFSLPAGPIQLSAGAEHRNDRFNQDYSEDDLAGNVLGSAVIRDTQAERSVTSGYSEVHIPVLGKGFNLPGAYSFDAYGAVRIDNYSDFGTTINPEARFTFYPVKDLLIRGSFSSGFRAPSLPELFAGGNQSFETVSDPNNPNPLQRAPQVLINGGGNPNLQPERSESYNIGVVYTPSFVPNLTVHADLWKIRYDDQIQQVDPQTLIDSGSPAVVRDAAGDITSITATYANLANTLVQGIDEGFTYSIGEPNKNLGRLTFDVQGTFYLTYNEQGAPGTPFQSEVGEDGAGLGAFPRYRQESTVTWDYHDFEYSVSNDFISQVDDSQAIGENFAPLSPNQHKIDSYSTFDMQASYTFEENKHDFYSSKGGIDWISWLDGTKFSVGCDNFLDFRPPETFNPNDEPAGTDQVYADYRGRFVYGAIKKVW